MILEAFIRKEERRNPKEYRQGSQRAEEKRKKFKQRRKNKTQTESTRISPARKDRSEW